MNLHACSTMTVVLLIVSNFSSAAETHITESNIRSKSASCSASLDLQSVDLESSIHQAICMSAEMEAAWAYAESRRELIAERRSAYLPKISASLADSLSKSNQKYSRLSSLSTNGQSELRTAGLDLSWILYDFGQRSSAVSEAQAVFDTAMASRDETLKDLILNIVSAYLSAVSARQNEQSSKKVVEIAIQNYEVANAKFKAGAAALAEPLQAESALAQAKLRHIADKGALEQSLGRLKIIMSIPLSRKIVLEKDIDYKFSNQIHQDIDTIFELATHNNPAVLEARATLQQRKAELLSVKKSLNPTISLSANLSKTYARQDLSRYGDYHAEDNSIGIQIQIPIFDGFSYRHRVRSAEDTVKQSQAELDSIQKNIFGEAWDRFEAMKIASENLAQTKKLVDICRQTLEVIQGRYKSGVGSMIEVLNALTAYSDAEMQNTRALSDWNESRFQLAATLGAFNNYADNSHNPGL